MKKIEAEHEMTQEDKEDVGGGEKSGTDGRAHNDEWGIG